MSNATNVKKNINKTKSTNQKKKKKKNPVLRFIRNFFITIFCILVLCAVACTGIILAVIKTAPSLDINGTILSFDQPSALYDSQGQQMDTVITTQKRTVVKLNSIPKNLTNAVISIEDEHFYEHGGIDIKRITGALLSDIKAGLF
jgi:penicillin-binding protein 1A